MLIDVTFIVLGNLIFLFLFWKRLKEDYLTNQIFTSAFYVLLGLNIFNLIAKRYLEAYWFWVSFLGVMIATGVSYIKYQLKLMEYLEALVLALIPGLALVYLRDFIVNDSAYSLVYFFILILLLIIFSLIDRHYKRFVWYKSGRVGFTGLTTTGLFFLIRGSIAMFFPTMISFSGKYDPLMSGTMAFLAFLGVFTLARSKT